MEEISRLMASGKLVKWLFYGDSITHGAFHTFGWRDYTELFAERVRFEMGRINDVVINTANSGDNSAGLLSGFDWRVKQFEPHVVFVMIGMNDCSSNTKSIDESVFENNLHKLVGRLREIGSLPVFQTTTLILPGTAPDREPYLPVYMEIVRKTAAAEKIPLVDHAAYWEKNRDKLYFWMSDAFHPNQYGQRVIAARLFEALGIGDAQSAVCRLFVP